MKGTPVDRGEILRHIGTLADKLERAPTRSEFIAETGISQCQIDNHFLSWREAVRAAGWEPKTEAQRIDDETLLQGWGDLARKLGHIPSVSEYEQQGRHNRTTIEKRFKCAFSMVHTKFREFAEGRPEWADVVALLPADFTSRRIEDETLLRDWAEVVRKLRQIPTVADYRRQGRFSRRSMEARFGPWSKIPAKFRAFAESRPEWADVVALLPTVVRDRRQTPRAPVNVSPRASAPPRHSKLSDRPIYGNPIKFRGLLHEPVNEDGVIFLFGMVARELGYLVEAVQAGFPDCEAKRQINPGKWQRVRIEFEYESRNFSDHGHAPDGCDVIVCWRHNWPECPPHLEIVELQMEIELLAKSEDDDV